MGEEIEDVAVFSNLPVSSAGGMSSSKPMTTEGVKTENTVILKDNYGKSKRGSQIVQMQTQQPISQQDMVFKKTETEEYAGIQLEDGQSEMLNTEKPNTPQERFIQEGKESETIQSEVRANSFNLEEDSQSSPPGTAPE